MPRRRILDDFDARGVEETAGSRSRSDHGLTFAQEIRVAGAPPATETGVVRLTLTIVKSSMRKRASRLPSPLRAKFAMGPVIVTIGRVSIVVPPVWAPQAALHSPLPPLELATSGGRRCSRPLSQAQK